MSEINEQTRRALMDVAHERNIQDGRWGHDFDDQLSDAWWGNMLAAYLGYVAQSIFSRGEKPTEEAALRYIPVEDEQLRTQLIKVAAIAVCYVEVLDRRRERQN